MTRNEDLELLLKGHPQPMCAIGWFIMRMVVQQGQERIDEEGCGAIYAALRWPSNPSHGEPTT